MLFHGGIDANRRGDLIDRFREDRRCRVFLATDAGGLGLNLQHASIVVNIDLPWNPAVLEQRIGRVHRLGQHKPVQVVSFIAERTIEEGMLTVLAFKKSLVAGALDGGERHVFLGGSRLSRFMETVETMTAAMEQPPSVSGDGATATTPHTETEPQMGSGPAAPAGAATENWEPLIQAGLA